jgi:hypothetical protein
MRRVFLTTLIAAAAALSAACSDITAPAGTEYVLVSINDNTLPTEMPEGQGLFILAGGFEVDRRGEMIDWIQFECREPFPGASDCSPQDDGTVRRAATFVASENRMYIGGGFYFPMEMDANHATIWFGEAAHVFRYERVPGT